MRAEIKKKKKGGGWGGGDEKQLINLEWPYDGEMNWQMSKS